MQDPVFHKKLNEAKSNGAVMSCLVVCVRTGGGAVRENSMLPCIILIVGLGFFLRGEAIGILMVHGRGMVDCFYALALVLGMQPLSTVQIRIFV